MNDIALARLISPSLGLILIAFCSASEAVPPELWEQAVQMEEQGAYGQAIAIYQQILSMEPASQRAAVGRGAAEWRLGSASDALNTLEWAVDLKPHNFWEAKGLYFLAEACAANGCPNSSRDAIHLLKKRYPELSWAAYAELLEARMDSADTTPFELALADELNAEEMFKVVLRSDPDIDDNSMITQLQSLVQAYPETRTALAARRSWAMVLTRDHARTTVAREVCQRLLDDLQQIAPDSLIRFEMEYRIAALDHRAGQKAAALARFASIVQQATDPKLIASAYLQAAGVLFEIFHSRNSGNTPIPPEEWTRLRSMCSNVSASPYATQEERVRADLMVAESYLWQKDIEAALLAAGSILDNNDDAIFPKELATARQVAGECLQQMGRHDEALVHYQWIIQHFGFEEIWPGLDNLARTYYFTYDALRRGGFAAEQVHIAGERVLTHFPDSEYAQLVLTAMSDDAAE